jgi:hypothetical protein
MNNSDVDPENSPDFERDIEDMEPELGSEELKDESNMEGGKRRRHTKNMSKKNKGVFKKKGMSKKKRHTLKRKKHKNHITKRRLHY